MNTKVYATIGLATAMSTATYFGYGLYAQQPQANENIPSVQSLDNENTSFVNQDDGNVWLPFTANVPFLKNRTSVGVLSASPGMEYCLKTELKDGVYHVSEEFRNLTASKLYGASHGKIITPDRSGWQNKYRTPATYSVMIFGTPVLKYSLDGTVYVRHFDGLKSRNQERHLIAYNDVLVVAEDLVTNKGCRSISLVFQRKGYKDVTLVADWKYFAVTPKHRPVDIGELKRQLNRNKNIWKSNMKAFPDLLHAQPLQKLRTWYFEGEQLVNGRPWFIDSRVNRDTDSVVAVDVTHQIYKEALNSIFACIEDQQHQDVYERLYGTKNLELALNNFRTLKAESKLGVD